MQKPRKLSERHWLFVKEFVSTGDRQHSAFAAGYVGETNVVAVAASKALARPDVKHAIEEYTKYLANRPTETIATESTDLLTREGRRRWYAAVANGEDPGGIDDDGPPWNVRVQAMKFLGDMDGDFLRRTMPQEANTHTEKIIVLSADDAKDFLQGRKRLDEVINVEGEVEVGGSGDGGNAFEEVLRLGDGVDGTDESVGDGP
jgi:hypothetical protein